MRKTLLFMAGLLMVAGLAQADEPAIVNDPPSAWENFRRVLATVEPSGDAIWSMTGKEFKAGSSIRLYTAERINVPVVKDLDVRLGWFETKGLYGTLSLALDRATGKEVLGHVHLGWCAGYSFDNDRDGFITGPVVGGKF